MKFKKRIARGRLLKRYKRFFADVHLDGEVVVAHVPNTGSLATCLYPDAACVVSHSDNPKRKLKTTLHFVETPSGWVGVDTSLPNALAFEAWEEGREWTHLKAARREYKLSKGTRLDLVLAPDEEALAAGRELHFVEIKNVTYAEDGVARFPDAVTTRGQKHLRELIDLVAAGHRAELLFVVQRENCVTFRAADDIDPEYGRLLREARRAGVIVRALACDIDPASGVTLSPRPIALDL